MLNYQRVDHLLFAGARHCHALPVMFRGSPHGWPAGPSHLPHHVGRLQAFDSAGTSIPNSWSTIYEFVSWDYYSQYDGKVIKFHGSSHHQPDKHTSNSAVKSTCPQASGPPHRIRGEALASKGLSLRAWNTWPKMRNLQPSGRVSGFSMMFTAISIGMTVPYYRHS